MQFFRRKLNELFHLESTPTMTYEFLSNSFNKKSLLNFLIKIAIKTQMSNLTILRRNSSFIFPLIKGAHEVKVLIS